jgi:hypothetical protein
LVVVNRAYVYAMCMHMCAHKKTGCKGTKKNWDVQIYEGKSA